MIHDPRIILSSVLRMLWSCQGILISLIYHNVQLSATTLKPQVGDVNETFDYFTVQCSTGHSSQY